MSGRTALPWRRSRSRESPAGRSKRGWTCRSMPERLADGVSLLDTVEGTLLDSPWYEGSITSAVIDGKLHDLVEGTALPDSVDDSDTAAGSLGLPGNPNGVGG